MTIVDGTRTSPDSGVKLISDRRAPGPEVVHPPQDDALALLENRSRRRAVVAECAPPDHDPISGSDAGANQPRGGQALTAALSVLVFIALANIVVCVVRIAAGSSDHITWLRLSLELVVCGALSACLWARLRARARASGDLEHPLAIETAEPASRDRRAGRRNWLRIGRPLFTAGLLVMAAFTVAGQWGTVESAVGHLTHLQWRWVRWSIYAEALSVVALASLGWILLRAGGRRLSLGSFLALTLASNALSVSVPGGPAWGAAFSFEQLRRRAIDRGLAAFVLLAMIIVSAVALLVLLVVGVDVAGGQGPAAPFRTLATALALLVILCAVAVLVILRVPVARSSLGGALTKLRGDRHGRLAELVRRGTSELAGVRCTPRTLMASLGAALLNWITDCACLVAAILAVAGQVPWRGVLVAYALAQVAANLPITPGGIGIVEGTLSLLLVAYGMPTGTAVAAVLLYRIISFWIFVPIGWATAGVMIALQRGYRPDWITRVPAPQGRPSPV